MTQKGGENRKFADSPTQTLNVCMDLFPYIYGMYGILFPYMNG